MKCEKLIKTITDLVLQKKDTIVLVGLLLILFIDVFFITLDFMPSNGDDLRLFSSVANINSPLKYFIQDAGEGKPEYRPFFSISIWIIYKIFGIRASMHQLANLVLHFVNAVLLLRILMNHQNNNLILFLLSSIFMISMNTVSAVSWIADRPTLFVGFFLLFVIEKFLSLETSKSEVSIPFIVNMSVFALLSKESGLIVPLFSILASLTISKGRSVQVGLVIACLLIIISYMGLRFYIFGSQASTYIGSGYVLGSHFDNWSELPWLLRIISGIENIFKVFIGTFFPIFDWEGRRLYFSEIVSVEKILTIASVTIILMVSWTKKMTMPQKYGLYLILINSVLSFAVFRYRIEYFSWLGFCVFVAASPRLQGILNKKRIVMVSLISVSLLICNTVMVDNHLKQEWVKRYKNINEDNLVTVHRFYGNYGYIDPDIVKKILDSYKTSAN